MKKSILYLFTLILILGFATSTQAFFLDTYFEDGTEYTQIVPGQNANYFIDVFPNSYAQKFTITVTLFDETGPILKNLGDVFQETIHSNELYYSPLLTVTQSNYIYPGDYFLQVKVTQTATNGDISIQTKSIHFNVIGERIINADFIYTPQEICAGEDEVTFTSTSISQGHDILLEEWFINNNKIGEGNTIKHTFQEPGIHIIKLKIKDDANREDEEIKQLYIQDCQQPEPNQPPIPNFVYEPQNPDTCDTVTFTSTSYDPDGFIVNEEWRIDGTLIHQGESETTFNHVFNEAKSYRVQIRVTDNDGETRSISKNVAVTECEPENIPPVANFEYAPEEIFAGDSVEFTSTSYDVDGEIVLEQWFLNGLPIYQFEGEASTFSRVFTQEGTYNMRLRVVDNDGAEDEITKTLIVKKIEEPNKPPIANFEYIPQNPDTCDTVTFTSTSYDTDGDIVNEKWYIFNELIYEGQNETSTEYTFQEPGTYRASIIVTDNDGATSEKTKNIEVEECYVPLPPVADFEYEPEDVFVGDIVTFTSTSYDVDGYIVNEKWYIGNTLVYEGVNETSFDYEITAQGPYRVRLVVTDNDGLTDEITKTFTSILPPIPNEPPVAKFKYAPLEPDTCDTVTFTSKSYDTDGYIIKEKWYIDGESVHLGTNETSFEYNFSEAREYKVWIHVMDDDGAVSTYAKKIEVKECEVPNEPPIAKFRYAPLKPNTCSVVTFNSLSYDTDGDIVNEKWYINNELIFEGENETTFNHTFPYFGSYVVKIIVEDNNGATASKIKTVPVSLCIEPKPPVAQFEYEPQHPETNKEVTFTSTSYDTDGYIVNEKWFVDNQLVHEGYNETTFNYAFSQDRLYEVTLTVTDNGGLTDTVTIPITVKKPEPIGKLYAIISGPESPFVGQEATYDGTASYDETGAQIVLYTWILEKGTQEVKTETTTTPYFNHVFTSRGQYYLTLIVTNEHGAQAQTTMSIFASRPYGPEYDEETTGEALTVDYHYVYGTDYGIVDANEYFTVYITVTNRGNEKLRNLRTTFALPEYGISDKSGFFDLREGDTKTVEFHTIITDFDYIPTGYHDALLGVSGAGITRYKNFPMTLQ